MKSVGNHPIVLVDRCASRVASLEHLRKEAEVRRNPVRDQHEVEHDEHEEDRQQERHGLRTPRRFRKMRKMRTRTCVVELPVRDRRGKEAEDRVATGRHRDRDRQDVVDDERASGDDAESGAEQLGGDEVAAAAARKMFDDARVGEGDDEDRRRGHQGQENREVGVRPEGPEGFLGAVGRGGEAVRAEPDPGQKRDEGDVVEDPGIQRIPRLPDENGLDRIGQGFGPLSRRGGIMFLGSTQVNPSVC